MEHTFGLDARMLTPIVARSLNDPSATLLDFALKALKPGVGNPTSLGVYRVSGTAQTASGPVPFSVVVKHLADGRPMMDASQPEFWNYWRREIAFFESTIAARIPSEIDFPIYLGHTVLADGTELFWNSDLGELEKSAWTWSECLHATQLVAGLNSIELTTEENYPWLNRDQLEGWMVFRPSFVEPLFAPAFSYARSKPHTSAALEKYEKFLHLQPELNRLLNRMPRVFVHGDFNLKNLVPRSAAIQKLIALDWQLCGIAALGSEVASIYNTACELGVIEASHENFNEICEL
ncbi:MAG: phosphotransferase, partial [Micrococcales bacterium]